MLIPNAEQFLKMFVLCYRECCSMYSDEEFTSIVWPLWPDFFFKKQPSNLLKSESVIAKTVAALNLEYWAGEPLRLDAVFYHNRAAEDEFPFPFLVAFEHEEDPRGFQNEVIKLLSVRCPLKVGITHTTAKNMGKQRETICQRIADRFRQIEAISREDPRTEYLFMIGCQERKKDPSWYHLSFKAGDGPGDQKFERIEGL